MVVLYGNSLVVSSIAASLADQPHLTLCRLETPVPDLAQRIASLVPDVLIFDLAAAHPDYAITLLQEYPRLLLIGVDVASARTLVLSGRQSQALTIDDLIHVIETYCVPGDETRPQPSSHGD